MEITCRICRNARRKKLIPLLKTVPVPGSNELEMGEKFEYCFGLKVTEIPNYPGICTKCEQQLNNFYTFKQQAIKSHYELLEIAFKENAFNNYEIKKSENYSDLDDVENIEDDINPLILETIDGIITKSDDEILDNSNTQENDKIQIKSEKLLEQKIMPLKNTFQPVENISPQMYYDELEENISRELKLNHSQKKTRKSKKSEDDNDCSELMEKEISAKPTRSETNEKDTSEKSKKTKKTLAEKISKTYKCDVCNKKFSNIQLIEGHINEKHKGLPAYQCEICGKTFKFICKKYYDNHMKDHQGLPRPYLCKLCPKSYHTKKDLGIHMRRHKNEKPFVCEICGTGFFTHAHLKRHIESHSDDMNYICDICHKGFRTRNTMQIHRKEMHFPKRYNCKICKKEFSRRNYYRNHLTKYHCDLEDEECGISDNNILKLHQSRIRLRFNCKECGKMFSQKHSLQNHISNCEIKSELEENETLYECNICGQKFKIRNIYIDHLQLFHNLECDVCHKKYRCKPTLRAHLKEIHLPKRFSCDMCHIKFGRKQYYKLHIMKHHSHLVDVLFPKTESDKKSKCSEIETSHEEETQESFNTKTYKLEIEKLDKADYDSYEMFSN